jgi:hypothetical protein
MSRNQLQRLWVRLQPDDPDRNAPPRAGRFAWRTARLDSRLVALVAAAIALAFAPASGAAPDAACLLAKADRYAAAQVEWQRTIADLVVAEAPAMRATAYAWRDDQVDRIELRRLAVADRVIADPTSFNEEKVLGHWLTFGPHEQAEFVRRDPRAAEVAARIEARAAPAPPDRLALRVLMHDRVGKSDAYRRALARLDAAVAAANAVPCPG